MILDGYGLNERADANAVAEAKSMLEEMNEAQRKSIILVIRHIMKKNPLTDSDCKNSLKVSK